MAWFNFISFCHLITIKCQFVLFFEFFELLFFRNNKIYGWWSYLLNILLRFLCDHVIKGIENDFCSANDRWTVRSVLAISINALQSHKIIYRIAYNSTKDSVFFVQMLTFSKSNEKLWSISVFSRVCHCYDTPSNKF